MTETILRLPSVKYRIGLSRSTIYALVANGTFPRPIVLSRRAVGWLESDVETWLASRIDMSRAQRTSGGTTATPDRRGLRSSE